MTKNLFLLRGLPGSGKTTLAKILLDLDNGEDTMSFSADDYFTDAEGNYNFDVNKLGEAHIRCKLDTGEAMAAGVEHIIVHNTFTTEKEMKYYIELAETFNYRLFVLTVENWHGNSSVHNVPERTLDRMERRYKLKLR